MQITAMSLIKDEERLELLKEIGGTKVYEERRRDSLKVMHETEGRRTHIEEVVSRTHVRPNMCDQCQRRQIAAGVAYLQARPGGTGSSSNMAAVHLLRPFNGIETCISTTEPLSTTSISTK